ncbi:cypemycin family RiPP [Microbacterium sp. VKM Ac-2923]|uniref:cypemycin family RiPP n=1 Tax=Microbacterium sp. VKM Ac-2923 TaxID=2929476 RepID=UPI001FB1E841|nr:cypemycin family RiPP [Microbacterium sp. VKM Ac-2923]MCJ1707115.1 cypemycin family RiPP [Microbacterium sp. VKM Ac-2923]
MQAEILDVQAFANQEMRCAMPGAQGDATNPAMTTPAFVTAAQFVVQGSTICLVC